MDGRTIFKFDTVDDIYYIMYEPLLDSPAVLGSPRWFNPSTLQYISPSMLLLVFCRYLYSIGFVERVHDRAELIFIGERGMCSPEPLAGQFNLIQLSGRPVAATFPVGI